MNIFNLFRRKKVTEQQVEKNESGIFFHEDSFNQVEFVPRENLSYLQMENEQIESISEENFDGYGFKDIYIRDENPIKLGDRKIAFKELDRILIELKLEKISEVYEGYGSTKWKCENTFAYTFNEAVLFVCQKNDIVQDFWIDNFRFHENDKTKMKLKEVLNKIGDELDLILNDWDLCAIIDLKEDTEIQKYLNEEL